MNREGPQIFAELIRGCARGLPPEWPEQKDFGPYFLEQIDYHSFAPMLAHLIHCLPSCDWPADVLRKIKKSAKSEALLEMQQEQELLSVLKAGPQRGITAILLKGTPLSYLVYPDRGLRPRADIDLLIQHRDLAALQVILLGRGYTAVDAVVGDLINHQVTFEKIDSLGIKHSFDVHWKLANHAPFSEVLNYSEVLAQSIPVPRLGPGVLAMSLPHALLWSCIHRVAHHDCSDRLIWLYDIHLLAHRQPQGWWEEFTRHAVGKKMLAICCDGVLLAKEWFNTEIPSEVLREWRAILSSQGDEGSARWLSRRPGLLSNVLLGMASLSSPGRKIKLLKEHLFPQPQYMLRKYDKKSRVWLPLLYLYRIARGLKKLI